MRLHIEVDTENRKELADAVALLLNLLAHIEKPEATAPESEQSALFTGIPGKKDVITSYGQIAKPEKGKLTDPATDSQIDYVSHFISKGYLLPREVNFDGMTKGAAATLIVTAKKRQETNTLPSPVQPEKEILNELESNEPYVNDAGEPLPFDLKLRKKHHYKDKRCRVIDCKSRVLAKGFCGKHYQQFKKGKIKTSINL